MSAEPSSTEPDAEASAAPAVIASAEPSREPAPDLPAIAPRPRRPESRWAIVWYPLALPVAYILAIWSASQIHPSWLVRPILVAVLVVLALTISLTVLLKDRHRAGLATMAITLAMLLTNQGAELAILAVAGALIGEGLWHRGRPWRNGRRISRFMSVLGAALLIVTAFGTVQQGTLQDAVADVQTDLTTAHSDVFSASAPDIYVILLDGYPGDDAATINPDFDADAFPGALEARGFDVERHARSNYLTTRLTVPTMLADQHIDAAPELDPPYADQAADARRLREFGDNGAVMKALRGAGYETITVTSPAAHLGLRRVDRVVDPPGPNEFDHALLTNLGIGRALDRASPDLFASIARDQILATYDSAAAVAAEPHSRPRFVWIHVLAPHPPLLFRADGAPILNASVLQPVDRTLSDPASRTARIKDTFDYAQFAANRAKELLDQMLAAPQRESVVVVFSDHGTDVGFDASNPLGSDLNERTSIVMAVRSPGHPGLLPAGTTPIGVLPRILNTYLGTSLPIRSDTSWAWPRDGSLLEAVPIDMGSLAP